MKPFFQEGLITLYRGDCLGILPGLDLKKALLFTDPPYGIGEAAGNNKSRGCKAKSRDYGNKEWDNKPPPPEYFEYVLANTKDQIIFGGNYFVEWLYNSSCWLFWDKDNGKTDFADGELAWTSFKTAVRKYKWRWQGFWQEKQGQKDVRVHPTQKPVGLAQLILKDYWDSSKYNLVIDTHMGSGSFGVACQRLKIPYIGIDTELEYLEKAVVRLAKVENIANYDKTSEGLWG